MEEIEGDLPVQPQFIQKQKCRTYRTHGRIKPYMSSPCYIELISFENEEPAKKELKTQLATNKSKKSHVMRSGASS